MYIQSYTCIYMYIYDFRKKKRVSTQEKSDFVIALWFFTRKYWSCVQTSISVSSTFWSQEHTSNSLGKMISLCSAFAFRSPAGGWPHVCRVKITFTNLLTNRFVSTTKISRKCVVKWIPLRISIRSRNNPTFKMGGLIEMHRFAVRVSFCGVK